MKSRYLSEDGLQNDEESHSKRYKSHASHYQNQSFHLDSGKRSNSLSIQQDSYQHKLISRIRTQNSHPNEKIFFQKDNCFEEESRKDQQFQDKSQQHFQLLLKDIKYQQNLKRKAAIFIFGVQKQKQYFEGKMFLLKRRQQKRKEERQKHESNRLKQRIEAEKQRRRMKAEERMEYYKLRQFERRKINEIKAKRDEIQECKDCNQLKYSRHNRALSLPINGKKNKEFLIFDSQKALSLVKIPGSISVRKHKFNKQKNKTIESMPIEQVLPKRNKNFIEINKKLSASKPLIILKQNEGSQQMQKNIKIQNEPYLTSDEERKIEEIRKKIVKLTRLIEKQDKQIKGFKH